MKTRRDFIKTSALGTGALALGSPLRGIAADLTVNSVQPKRFIFIRKSNGLRPHELALPTFSTEEAAKETKKEAFEVDLDKHEIPAWMKPIEKFKANMTILQGLSSQMSENGHFSYSSVMGAYKSSRNSLSGIKRATIDFELAKLFPTPFGHVELALRGNYSAFDKGIISGYSAPAPNQRNYCYADPETAYNELFKSVTNPAAVDSDNSMLAFLEGEEEFKAKVLNGYEKLKLSNHISSLDSIRDRNKKLTHISDRISKYLPVLDKIHLNGGLTANTLEKQRAMTDILIAALATGLTNVITYTIDELSTPQKGLPGNEGDVVSLHEIGHNGSYSGIPADKIRENVRICHMEQIAKIAEELKKIPEGKGTMFDNTMIMYFPEGGEGHHGLGLETPYIILSGDKCNIDIAGRYIRLPYLGTEGHKTIGNWYTTLLNAHGNPIKHYGDLDQLMARSKLDQLGSIKQFMA